MRLGQNGYGATLQKSQQALAVGHGYAVVAGDQHTRTLQCLRVT
jgi:hypothetical protein